MYWIKTCKKCFVFALYRLTNVYLLDVLSNRDFQTMDKSIIIIISIVTCYVLNIPSFTSHYEKYLKNIIIFKSYLNNIYLI